MKRIALLCGMVFLSSCLSFATVIGFDDLSNGAGAPQVPSNYASVTWDAQWHYWTGSAGTFNPHSAPNLAYFNTANDGGFNFSAPVVFNGAWFADNTVTAIHYVLFLNSAPVFTGSDFDSPTGAMSFFASGYGGPVDRVVIHITTGALNSWTLDDVTYSAAGVPEPATLGMLMAGAGVLLVLRRRIGALRP
jgi:hypothetical protein